MIYISVVVICCYQLLLYLVNYAIYPGLVPKYWGWLAHGGQSLQSERTVLVYSLLRFQLPLYIGLGDKAWVPFSHRLRRQWSSKRWVPFSSHPWSCRNLLRSANYLRPQRTRLPKTRKGSVTPSATFVTKSWLWQKLVKRSAVGDVFLWIYKLNFAALDSKKNSLNTFWQTTRAAPSRSMRITVFGLSLGWSRVYPDLRMQKNFCQITLNFEITRQLSKKVSDAKNPCWTWTRLPSNSIALAKGLQSASLFKGNKNENEALPRNKHPASSLKKCQGGWEIRASLAAMPAMVIVMTPSRSASKRKRDYKNHHNWAGKRTLNSILFCRIIRRMPFTDLNIRPNIGNVQNVQSHDVLC